MATALDVAHDREAVANALEQERIRRSDLIALVALEQASRAACSDDGLAKRPRHRAGACDLIWEQ